MVIIAHKKNEHRTDKNATQHLLNAMFRLLHEKGFKITSQRKLILEAIANQIGWHVHPKDIYAYVHDKDKNIGSATVYRTLKMLEETDLLNKIYMMGGNTTEHINEHGIHYHLICLGCGNIEDVNDNTLSQIKSHVNSDHGFLSTQIKLSIYGMCENCKHIK